MNFVDAIRDVPIRNAFKAVFRDLARVEGRTPPSSVATTVSITGSSGLQILTAIGADSSVFGAPPQEVAVGYLDRTPVGKGGRWFVTCQNAAGVWSWLFTGIGKDT